MSLHPQPIPPVPEVTARVARAAFPKGNIYLQIRDTLGSIYVDEDFADLFSVKRLKKSWFDRYGRRVENYRLPKLNSERETLGNQMGEDGFNLLKKIYAPNAPEWLRIIPAVEILRIVWVQQFYAPIDAKVKGRSPSDMPPSTIAIHSPYDVEAHYSSKRSVNWVGYKAHVTEICDEDLPHFITHVQTTLSTVTL